MSIHALARDLQAARSVDQRSQLLKEHGDVLLDAPWDELRASGITETLLDGSIPQALVSFSTSAQFSVCSRLDQHSLMLASGCTM